MDNYLLKLRPSFQVFRFLGYFPVEYNRAMQEFRFAPAEFCFGFSFWMVFNGSLIYLYVEPQNEASIADSGRLQYATFV